MVSPDFQSDLPHLCSMVMTATQPLILTLKLDEESFSFFNRLRRLYFPQSINYLDAHLTLFHHLPPAEPSLITDLKIWSSDLSPLPLQVAEVKSIGKGVAYKIECQELLALHKQMLAKWKAWLTPQDSQNLWPHITVQNKVSPQEARQTLQILQASFRPFTATGIGLCLWSYEGGPWKLQERFPFNQPPLPAFETKRK